jgi:hypothetical protein
MDNKTFSKNYKQFIFDGLKSIPSEEIISIEDIPNSLKNIRKCPNCDKNLPIKLKKFKKIDEQLDLAKINDDFGRCQCGKRHLDIVMLHVLKIMKEENINLKRFNLRNGAIPILTPLTTKIDNSYVSENSIIILHPALTRNTSKRILEEVSEIKGVLKGDSKETVGMIDSNSQGVCYELLDGSDIRCDVIQSPLGEIAINKIQHLSYLEFPSSMENKIMKLWNYIKTKHFSEEEIANLRVLDGTCGNGTLGIFLLKLGVKKVIFNDIWKPATIMTSLNLKANGFKIIEENFKENFNDDKIATGDNFEVYNVPLEYLTNFLAQETPNKLKKKENKSMNLKNESNMNKFDICILDCFPKVDTTNFEKIGNLLAKDVLVI